QRFVGRQDSDLLTFITNHANFTCPNTLVNADKTLVDTIPPSTSKPVESTNYSMGRSSEVQAAQANYRQGQFTSKARPPYGPQAADRRQTWPCRQVTPALNRVRNSQSSPRCEWPPCLSSPARPESPCGYSRWPFPAAASAFHPCGRLNIR